METNQTGTSKQKILISALVAMLLINGVTLYFLFSETHDKNDITQQKTALQQDFKNLSDTLDARKSDIDQLLDKNTTLDKTILAKEQIIEQDKQQIEELFAKSKLTEGELASARGMIAKYQASISDLQSKLNEANLHNVEITHQNEQLAVALTSEKETTSQLCDENAGLTQKIATGSVLQLSRVDVLAVKRKNNGTEVCVSKAKAADDLKISFETGNNKVLDPGKVSFYVRIINPHGETIAVNEQGSGVIPATEGSKPVQYTKKADIQWTQSNKKVVVYWGRYIQNPGTYRVEVYQGPNVIGHGAVRLS